MREIGGYMELDRYHLPMLHEGALALNCGRNALRYLIECKHIQKLLLPLFLCDTVKSVCHDVSCRFYRIRPDFTPEPLFPEPDEWVYVVNYYGQLSGAPLDFLRSSYPNLIVDNAQAYFASPLPETDTLYTCRKFFGVPDGAFLYTNAPLASLPTDESFDHMHYLLGRFERSGSEFYQESSLNNDRFDTEPVKLMSPLTKNLLRGIDYASVERARSENFAVLGELLSSSNKLSVHPVPGPFAYPYLTDNGLKKKKLLAAKGIYIPTLWPEISSLAPSGSTEAAFAEDILPLPVDQRYTPDDMRYMVSQLLSL